MVTSYRDAPSCEGSGRHSRFSNMAALFGKTAKEMAVGNINVSSPVNNFQEITDAGYYIVLSVLVETLRNHAMDLARESKRVTDALTCLH